MGRKEITTIKHFLNKRLKPRRIFDPEGNTIEFYPVYFKLRTNQQQTQIKSHFWIYGSEEYDNSSTYDRLEKLRHGAEYSYLSEDQINPNNPGSEFILKKFEKEKSFILEMIKFMEESNINFNIRSISSHIEFYSLPFQYLISEVLKNKLKVEMTNMGLEVYRLIDWHTLNFEEIMKGFSTIFKGYEFYSNYEGHVLETFKKYLPYQKILLRIKLFTSGRTLRLIELRNLMEKEGLFQHLEKGVEEKVYDSYSLEQFMIAVQSQTAYLGMRNMNTNE